jgi:hypothetical protein
VRVSECALISCQQARAVSRKRRGQLSTHTHLYLRSRLAEGGVLRRSARYDAYLSVALRRTRVSAGSRARTCRIMHRFHMFLSRHIASEYIPPRYLHCSCHVIASLPPTCCSSRNRSTHQTAGGQDQEATSGDLQLHCYVRSHLRYLMIVSDVQRPFESHHPRTRVLIFE